MGVYQSTHTGQEIDTCLDTYLSSSTLPAALATAKTEIINAVYPVGSIYMSINNTNPSTLFGGTWVQIEDTFLLACGTTYTAGDTGGEAEHTLTVAEMPSHTHSMKYSYWVNANVGIKSYNYPGGSGYYYGDTSAAPNNTGSGSAHNNMPPYLAVYVWKRTA